MTVKQYLEERDYTVYDRTDDESSTVSYRFNNCEWDVRFECYRDPNNIRVCVIPEGIETDEYDSSIHVLVIKTIEQADMLLTALGEF